MWQEFGETGSFTIQPMEWIKILGNDVASNMAAITQEQSASAEEIEATAINIQELANIVSDNSANVESDSNDLAGTAANLKERISGFTIEANTENDNKIQ